jgi:hypothetical protein
MSSKALTFDEIITEDKKAEILANTKDLVALVNEVLRNEQFTYVPGKSISFCAKQSPKYQALAGVKGGQTQYVNRIKSILKAYKVGETLTLDSIVKGFWAKFDGTTAEKDGSLKSVKVSFMRPDIKASKEDQAVIDEFKMSPKDVEIRRLNQRILELEADGSIRRSE